MGVLQFVEPLVTELLGSAPIAWRNLLMTFYQTEPPTGNAECPRATI
jgi:hypothetical protein